MTEDEMKVSVALKMIADAEESKRDAIRHEDYARAVDLRAYIDGMRQILMVFDPGGYGH